MDRRTPPPISWTELATRRVAVWGLGMEGQANVRKARSLGIEPVLVDDQPGPDRPDVHPTEPAGLALMRECDVVVKTPGISRYRPEVADLADAGVAVVGGLGLWLAEAPLDRVVCVTGTKGKSTTTSIVGHLLNALGHRTFVGGNLGAPPYDPDLGEDAGEPDFWIIETSSYQATDLAVSPEVTAVVSLSPDHLSWHGDDTETYFRDKLSLCRQPGARVTVANGTDPALRERRELLGPEVEWVTPERGSPTPEWVGALGLLGWHNRVNAEIARECVQQLGVAVAEEDLVRAAAGLPALPSRMQVAGRVGEVRFIDDSLSTNVLSSIAAVEAIEGPLALLAGGFERGIDYAPLAACLLDRTAPTLLVTLPSNGPRIEQAVDATRPGTSSDLVVQAASDLLDGVNRAYRWLAASGGTVLLSPAAASFDLFRDYQHRAEVFRGAMDALRQ